MTKLTEKLIKVQSTLKAPKNQRNNFGNYNYRSCEDILEAVKPLLAENGLVLTISDDMVMLGNRFYVKATATISDGESSITNSAFAREEETKKGMDSSQITGSASSYARKYALNGLLCIDDTKDADATNTHGKEEKQQNVVLTKVQPASTANDDIVKKKIADCKKAMSKHNPYREGSEDYCTVTKFANKLHELGYKDEANEIISLLDSKTEKDFIPV